MDRKYLLYFAFVLLFGVTIVGLFMPFWGFETWLTSETFSFVFLLCIFCLVYYFVGSSDLLRRIKALKVSPSGIEVILAQVQKELLAEEQIVQPEVIKDELEEIRQASKNPLERLILTDNKLEEKIKILSEANNLNYRGFSRAMTALNKLNYLDSTVSNLLSEFRPLRNEIVHDIENVSDKDIGTAIAVGELLLSRLTIIYVQDVPLEKETEYIRNSEENNPKLHYFRGKSKSGEEGFIGIYYSVRKQAN